MEYMSRKKRDLIKKLSVAKKTKDPLARRTDGVLQRSHKARVGRIMEKDPERFDPESIKKKQIKRNRKKLKILDGIKRRIA